MNWEIKFLIFANGFWKWSVFDITLPWLTYLGSHIGVALFIILSPVFKRNKSLFKNLIYLYGIESLIIYSLKYITQRQRPLYLLNISTTKEILDPSFPSAHATYSFMMATLLGFWLPQYRHVFFVVATFIAWTRLYLVLHYPTDVIVGALLGYIITKVFIKKGIYD